MNEGWQLFSFRGIALRIHPSWFVILAVLTLGFQQSPLLATRGEISGAALWAVSLSMALLLFVSVLLHELGHSLTAIAHGVRVRSITLFLLGGVAQVDRECATARGAFLVAAAGPAVSLLLGLVLLSSAHGARHLSPVLGVMAEQLGAINLVLALFNLLPGLPFDGGLILKALVWQFTGSQRRGVEVANATGRFLSLLAVGMGVVLLLRGGGIAGLWLMLIGWFGLGAARNQSQLLILQRVLRELPVREASARRFRVLEAGTSLRQISGQAGSPGGDGLRPDWLLVCDRGRWQGLLDESALQQLPVQRWDGERVEHHLLPLDTLPAIAESAPIWQAVHRLDALGVDRLLVLSAAGLPCGTLERPDVGEAVLKRLGLRLPPALLSSARRQGSYPLGMGLERVVRSMIASGEVTLETAAGR
ncbi:MAG: site-2 protease family protein [Cyanobacteriota bacterium]|nr:site-2 protease family protein [Cyanobacteriota bacterium]